MVLCQKNRKNTVEKFLKMFAMEREVEGEWFRPVEVVTDVVVADAIYKANGEAAEIRRLLNEKVCCKCRQF